MSEDIFKDELRQAMKAREVLDNDAFKDAVRMIDQALLTGMRNAAIADDKLRLRLLDKYEALHDLLDQLQSTVNTGLLAEEEIRRKTISERVKEMLHIN
jgi:hypothetical protein